MKKPTGYSQKYRGIAGPNPASKIPRKILATIKPPKSNPEDYE